MNNISVKRKVLVLGEGNRSFLSIIRSLGRKNIEIHVGWYSQKEPALKSKYINKKKLLPKFSIENNKWKDVLIKTLVKEQYDLVIPCVDSAIIPLQLNRYEFLKYTNVYLINDKAFKIVNNKIKTNELARKLHINLPKEKVYNRNEYLDIDALLIELGLPIVIKPISSYSKENLNRKNFVKKVYNKKQLRFYLENMEKALLQEFFIGKGVGIEVLAKNGKILIYFQHVRIHEPMEGGGSSYRKSETINSELRNATSKLMKSLNYTGVAMIEFRYNFKKKNWILMEINGRFWGSLPLAIAAGIDFPYNLYQMIVENKKNFNQNYKINIYCRNLKSDLLWMLKNLNADKSNPSLNTLSNFKVISELKNLLTLKEKSDTFVSDDPIPGFYEIFQDLFILIKNFKMKTKIKFQYFLFFRFFKKRELRKMLKSVKSILFVCKGNICRSPFAEAVAKLNLPKSINVSSRGYLNLENREAPSKAITIAKNFGFDISGHKSKILEQRDLLESDIVFIFDEFNYSHLINFYPNLKYKIYFLGVLGEGNVLIKDPLNMNKKNFKKIYFKIIYSINCLKNEYKNLRK